MKARYKVIVGGLLIILGGKTIYDRFSSKDDTLKISEVGNTSELMNGYEKINFVRSENELNRQKENAMPGGMQGPIKQSGPFTKQADKTSAHKSKVTRKSVAIKPQNSANKKANNVSSAMPRKDQNMNVKNATAFQWPLESREPLKNNHAKLKSQKAPTLPNAQMNAEKNTDTSRRGYGFSTEDNGTKGVHNGPDDLHKKKMGKDGFELKNEKGEKEAEKGRNQEKREEVMRPEDSEISKRLEAWEKIVEKARNTKKLNEELVNNLPVEAVKEEAEQEEIEEEIEEVGRRMRNVKEVFSFNDASCYAHLKKGDLRPLCAMPLLPIIFSYKGGGEDSRLMDVCYNAEKITEGKVPAGLLAKVHALLRNKGIDLGGKEIDCYEAYSYMRGSDGVLNYFPHPFVMNDMIMGPCVTANVELGAFETKNLEPDVRGSLAFDKLGRYEMIFHDGNMLSPDTARFKLSNPDRIGEGWFVSVSSNGEKAALMHWTFIPNKLADSDELQFSPNMEKKLFLVDPNGD